VCPLNSDLLVLSEKTGDFLRYFKICNPYRSGHLRYLTISELFMGDFRVRGAT